MNDIEARIFKEWLADNTNIIPDDIENHKLPILKEILELELGIKIDIKVKED